MFFRLPVSWWASTSETPASFWVLHVLQEAKHGPQFLNSVRGQPFRAVLLKEPFQALMDDVLNPHLLNCSLLPYGFQHKTILPIVINASGNEGDEGNRHP